MSSLIQAFILPGLSFGLAAGISPGPLLTLVIGETLKGGWRRGIRIALAPILSDGPIVLVAALLVGAASNLNFFLGTISLAGGLFLLYIGYESLKTKRGIDIQAIRNAPSAEIKSANRGALLRGIITNYLNPAPYVFHFTISAPIVARSFAAGQFSFGLIFLLAFFSTIVGVKIVAAFIVDRSQSLLTGMAYVWLMRFLGVMLVWFAIQNASAGVAYLLKV
jgi:threonine/homoserine/homoserine lactone efflux protein